MTTVGPTITVSESDKRLYRHITLPNLLQALLISDSATDRSAAALSVRVGHFSDPKELPGLAHFLEHMLFLGTEKYPNEAEFKEFLASHGGRSNASTGTEFTRYHFEVVPEHFEPTLDRFSQFFAAPLFLEGATERELNAVHSENQKNLQDDGWRLRQLVKHSARPEHPYHKFGTGNLQTLRDTPAEAGIEVRKELLAFHKKWYSANLMCLVVYGADSLDQLQQWVELKFAGIANSDTPAPVCPPSPFGSDTLGHLFRVVPVKDKRSLELLFPVRSVRDLYKEKPTRYLSHLIGHEGEGSILSFLKAKGWATALSAGGSTTVSGFTNFSIFVSLTPEGLAHVNDVIGCIFSYIHYVLAEPHDWVYRELSIVEATRFRFKSKEAPQEYAFGLCESLQVYSSEDVLSGSYMFERFDAALIRQFTACLTPSNCRFQLVSREFAGQTDQVEPWYGTEYSKTEVSAGLLSQWAAPPRSDAFHLPPANEFIAAEMPLRAPVTGKPHPELLIDTPALKLWHKQDDTFLLPRAQVRVAIVTPRAYDTCLDCAHAALFVRLVEDSLNEYAYLADSAGLYYSAKLHARGLSVTFKGFSTKMPRLVRMVLQRLSELEVNEDRYKDIAEKLAREYKDQDNIAPHSQCRYVQRQFVEERLWNYDQKLEALARTTAASLQEWSRQFMGCEQSGGPRLEVLAMGNLDTDDVAGVARDIRDTLPVRETTFAVPSERVVSLPRGKEMVVSLKCRDPNNTNSAIFNYYQVGIWCIDVHVQLALLTQILRERAFHQLRTVEQLGYIVFTSTDVHAGVHGLRMVVQSTVLPPPDLDARIEALLASFESFLADMPDAVYQSHVDSLAKRYLESHKSLAEEVDECWHQMYTHRFMWDEDARLSAAVHGVSRESLQAFFREHVLQPATRRKLSSRVFGKLHNLTVGESTETVAHFSDASFAAFKQTAEFFPHST